MTVIDSPDKLWYSLAGALLLWLGKVVWGRVKHSVAASRERVDKQAALEKYNRQLILSLHDHRVAMVKSGQWTQDTLPPFIKE